MNTMQSFYTSITSASKLQGAYSEALADLTRINRMQMDVLASDLGWQEWGAQNQQNITA